MKQTLKKTLLMLCVVSIIAAGIPTALAQTNVTGTHFSDRNDPDRFG